MSRDDDDSDEGDGRFRRVAKPVGVCRAHLGTPLFGERREVGRNSQPPTHSLLSAV